MKIDLFSILICLGSGFVSCSENDSAKDQIKAGVPLDSIAQTQSATPPDDTLFIHREVTKDMYHAIFIDKSDSSIFCKRLCDFTFNTFDSAAYFVNYKHLKKQEPEAFKAVNTTDLPEHWLPVYSYKENYYLYAPSDWGNARKRILNDSAFVYWYMDGPFPLPLKGAKQVSSGEHLIAFKNVFNNHAPASALRIHEINATTQLSIFEFSHGSQEKEYKLFVPVKHSAQYPIIVNYCKDQKQMEFEFDAIDFEKLLDKRIGKKI